MAIQNEKKENYASLCRISQLECWGLIDIYQFGGRGLLW